MKTGVRSSDLKAQRGVIARISSYDIDIDITCKVESYRVVRVPKLEDPVEAQNKGAKFELRTQEIIDQAQTGDVYYFEDIK